MKTTIKLISGAAILLASLSGQAIAQKPSRSACPANISPFTFVKQGQAAGLRGGHVEPDR